MTNAPLFESGAPVTKNGDGDERPTITPPPAASASQNVPQLRPYQQAAIAALFEYWRAGGGNPLLAMATGTGKSMVIGEIARRLMLGSSRRVAVLTHVQELVDQDARAIRAVWPDAPIGICSAGLGERNADARLVVAGIQSVFRNPEALGKRNLVIVDEAHLVPSTGDGMYLTTIDALRELYPEMRVCGLTATPFRLDSGRLDEGDNRLFDRVVYSYGIAEAIRDGWLSPLIARRPAAEIDVRGVARRGGEFVAGALEDAADVDELVSAAAEEINQRGRDRRSWLCFCTGVRHAEHFRDALRDRGVTAEMVTGETSTRDREAIFAAFRAGRIRALTGANVFTTGFDAPAVDLIAMLRPTLSTGLFVQMAGRGTRLAPGKQNCLVLDFAGNVRRHGPVDAVAVNTTTGKEERRGAVSVDSVRAKVCPECNTYAARTALKCDTCGYVWEQPRKPKHEAQADDVAILSEQVATVPSDTPTPEPATKRIQVDEMSLHYHAPKPGKPPTLRVTFRSGQMKVSEWIALQHTGFARAAAVRKWQRLGGRLPAPTTVAEAISRRRELTAPDAILIERTATYWAVVRYRTHEAAA